MRNFENLDIKCEIVEREEEFIYSAIYPYLEMKFQYKIPKKLLIRAITCFAEEHPEEYKILKGETE